MENSELKTAVHNRRMLGLLMDTFSPLVSIIIPVYNAENYIERCINSIKSQTNQSWEAIIVNDGSTDGSLDLLKSLCENDFRFRIISKENGGAASARNVGISKARAKYIMFVDADDSITENCIELMLAVQERYQCELVTAGIRFQEQHEWVFPLHGLQKLVPSLFFKYFLGGSSAKLYKKEIIDRYNIRFPEDMKVAEDYCFFTTYALHVKCFYSLPDILYIYYYDNAASLMHHFFAGKQDYSTYCSNIEAPWRVYNYILKRESVDRDLRPLFIYELYRRLWVMYYASLKSISVTHKRTLTSFFREKHRDFEKEVGLLKRILLPQRYPRLYEFARRMKYCICHFIKRA